MEYNGFGEPVAKTGAGREHRYAYDKNGIRVWQQYPDQAETRREFDALNRPIRVVNSQ